jgi:hypothetical protein
MIVFGITTLLLLVLVGFGGIIGDELFVEVVAGNTLYLFLGGTGGQFILTMFVFIVAPFIILLVTG